jgi:hypothetical protein
LYHVRERFDIDALDLQDPFEIDSQNIPHLAKHPPFTAEDLYDILGSDPIFFEADDSGDADWLMVGEVPGHDTPLVVPLSKPHGPNLTQCRPIGIYEASGAILLAYREERSR